MPKSAWEGFGTQSWMDEPTRVDTKVEIESQLRALDIAITEFVFHSLRNESDYCDNYYSLMQQSLNRIHVLNPSFGVVVKWIADNIKNRYERRRFINVLLLGVDHV